MNSVFVNPGIYSCAVDAFLEISTHLFLPYLSNLLIRNDFTDLLFNACSHYMSSIEDSSLLTGFREPVSGAPNDQFVVKYIIIPQLMKINVIKAFSGVFQCCWENIICSFFPARHTRNFPASEIKLVGFPAS